VTRGFIVLSSWNAYPAERRREVLSVKRKLVLIATIVAALAAAAGGIAIAAGDDDATETPITGADLQKASDSALASTGGGRVTGTEVGDEESYYEVEVTLDDGSQVDVQLDKSFEVVGSEADGADED
jgi:uncharacterized membrane protein YkoI